MFLAATTINLDHLMTDLLEGDLVTWGIVFGVVFFTLLSAYQKFRERQQGDHGA